MSVVPKTWPSWPKIKPDSRELDPVIQIGAWGRWFLDRRITSGDDKAAVGLAKLLI